MENNIFIKNKNNPDVAQKKNKIEIDRNVIKFNRLNVTYNSITNNTPANVKTQRDLELQKDAPINNINTIINQKALERQQQDSQYMPIKQKVILEDDIKHINNNYTELKNEQLQFSNVEKQRMEANRLKHRNILNNLRKNGAL